MNRWSHDFRTWLKCCLYKMPHAEKLHNEMIKLKVKVVDVYLSVEKRFCDFDLWTHNFQRLISSWPDIRVSFGSNFKSFQRFRIYQLHKISITVALWPWTFNPWPWKCHQCHVDLVMNDYDEFHYKKLSYCRKSAHLTSLYRTVQKAFRYVEPFRRGLWVWQTDDGESQSRPISRSYLSIMHSFSVTSTNIAMNDISLKLDSFGYIFCIGLSSTTLMLWAPKLPNSVK